MPDPALNIITVINLIGNVMVRVLDSSAVGHGFVSR